MTIKNETAFTKECMEGAMRASNLITADIRLLS